MAVGALEVGGAEGTAVGLDVVVVAAVVGDALGLLDVGRGDGTFVGLDVVVGAAEGEDVVQLPQASGQASEASVPSQPTSGHLVEVLFDTKWHPKR